MGRKITPEIHTVNPGSRITRVNISQTEWGQPDSYCHW